MNGILEEKVLDELISLQPNLVDVGNDSIAHEITIYEACKGCKGRASG